MTINYKYRIQCKYCPEIVERENIKQGACCFDCKMKRCKKAAQKSCKKSKNKNKS